MDPAIWAAVISGGVSLAQGMLEDEDRDQKYEQSRENLILQLQDNERGRANQLERAMIAAGATKEAAELGLEGTKKRIMGDVLLQQGKGQERLMLERLRAVANTPERFNDAASVLARVLKR